MFGHNTRAMYLNVLLGLWERDRGLTNLNSTDWTDMCIARGSVARFPRFCVIHAGRQHVNRPVFSECSQRVNLCAEFFSGLLLGRYVHEAAKLSEVSLGAPGPILLCRVVGVIAKRSGWPGHRCRQWGAPQSPQFRDRLRPCGRSGPLNGSDTGTHLATFLGSHRAHATASMDKHVVSLYGVGDNDLRHLLAPGSFKPPLLLLRPVGPVRQRHGDCEGRDAGTRRQHTWEHNADSNAVLFRMSDCDCCVHPCRRAEWHRKAMIRRGFYGCPPL